MNSPAHDLALYLQAQGVGTFGGANAWSISVGREPVSPPEAVTLYDTGGAEPDTDELSDKLPTFQVRVRGPAFPAVYAKQEAIRDLLIMPEPIVTATSRFVGIQMSSDIIDIGRDDGDRFILVANYRARRTA